MQNPLTDKQIEELNEIIKLPREEQTRRLPEFLRKLNKEQIEFLKKYQSQQCLFCSLVLGTALSYKVYEDNEFLGILDINPANLGHVLIIPKSHIRNSYEISSRVFEIANLIAKKMREKLDADSNIFVANGENAGQKIEHVIVHVIPRYKNDDINLTWQPKKIDHKKLQNIMEILQIKEEKSEIKKEKKMLKQKRKERIP